MLQVDMKAMQRLLLHHDALCYRPSLSHQMYDVLYSYWRLPRAIIAQLARDQPSMNVGRVDDDVRVDIDWNKIAVLLSVSPSVAPTQIIWAVAIHMEHFFVEVGLELKKWPLDSRQVLPHRTKLPLLLRLLDDHEGEYYMAFVILITILERVLFVLYHQNKVHEATSDSNLKTDKKNLTLCDLLQSNTLKSVLPHGMLLVMKTVFSSSGLNLRNLVWHGFLCPVDVPKCFGCLTMLLILAVSPYVKPELTTREYKDATKLFDLQSLNDQFVIPNQMNGSNVWTEVLETITQKDVERWVNSSFFPRGRVNLIRKAIQALIKSGNEFWFLFAILPALEHGIRQEFLRRNQVKWKISSEYNNGQIDGYHTTLDGFGQKDNHQVLIHPFVILEENLPITGCVCRSTPRKKRHNGLYNALPLASLSVCIDLFMMAMGPNLRAKLCHGKSDLSGFFLSHENLDCESETPLRSVSTATQLLFLALLLIAESRNSGSSNHSVCQHNEGSESTPSIHELLTSFQNHYSSSFHPFYQLYRALSNANKLMEKMPEFRTQWTTIRLKTKQNAKESQTWIEFPRVAPFRNGSNFGLLEESSKVSGFRCLINDRETENDVDFENPKKLAEFPSLLIQLQVKLDAITGQIQQHFMESHHVNSVFLRVDEYEDKEMHMCQQKFSLISHPLDRGLERYVLALSDHDGLRMISCMVESIASSQRALRNFPTRVVQLQNLIYEGKARTNHRRSFLNSVLFISIFEQVQRLCLGLVEHQLVYLLEKATQLEKIESEDNWAAKPSASLRCGSCMKATVFEHMQHRLLQFITAFEVCTGTQKSEVKAAQLTLQFLDSKAMKALLSTLSGEELAGTYINYS